MCRYTSDITNRINRLVELPYKCVFFNGEWGIGKSYAADQASVNKIRVSLSGLNSAESIEQSIIDALVSDASGLTQLTKFIKKTANTVVNVAESFEKTKNATIVVSELAKGFLSSNSILRIVLEKKKDLHIIILDDLERIDESIDVAEVFRVIEVLCSYANMKVVIIGDKTKINDNQKEKFSLYEERYFWT